jgi:hypothetical protein
MTVIDDVAGWSRTGTYGYSGGVYDRVDKVFRGFATVTEKRADGTTLQTDYSTVAPLDGHPSRVVERDAQDAVVSTTALEWITSPPSSGSYPVAVFPRRNATTNGYRIPGSPPASGAAICSPGAVANQETLTEVLDGVLTSRTEKDGGVTVRVTKYSNPIVVSGIGGDSRWTITLPGVVSLLDVTCTPDLSPLET